MKIRERLYEFWIGVVCANSLEVDFKSITYPLTQITSEVACLVPTTHHEFGANFINMNSMPYGRHFPNVATQLFWEDNFSGANLERTEIHIIRNSMINGSCNNRSSWTQNLLLHGHARPPWSHALLNTPSMAKLQVGYIFLETTKMWSINKLLAWNRIFKPWRIQKRQAHVCKLFSCSPVMLSFRSFKGDQQSQYYAEGTLQPTCCSSPRISWTVFVTLEFLITHQIHGA